MIDKKIKKMLKKLENRTPEEEEKSRIQYCKEAIIDKKFKLTKWVSSDNKWTHDHCDFCGEHISDKDEAYTNKNNDWFCKSCFKKYKKELNLLEIKK
jgi:formylmethanofuran dehydrogenase subunit E